MTSDAVHSPLKQHAAHLWEYQPQAVLRHSDGSLKVFSGEALRQIARGDEVVKILFYDMHSSPDGSEIIALQAGEFHWPLDGTAPEFEPLVFEHRGCRLEANAQYLCAGDSSIILWRIQKPHRDRRPFELDICPQAHSRPRRRRVVIPTWPFAGWKKTAIVQQAVQKDYPFIWIQDHILFMQRAHKIGRYILYDNGSEDYADLLSRLSALQVESGQVLLVNWPFPRSRMWYLRARKGRGDGAAQIAAYNHGLRLLGHLAHYGMNLDLDEYLYNDSGMSLKRFIARETRVKSWRRLGETPVPNTPAAGQSSPVRAFGFKYIAKKPTGLRGHDKYFYKTGPTLTGEKIQMLVVHRAVPLFSGGQVNWWRKMLRWFARSVGKEAGDFTGPKRLGFYHYYGINTGWRLRMMQEYAKRNPAADMERVNLSADWLKKRMAERSLNPRLYVRNDKMLRLLERVGLGDQA